jgi:hypothetical protein
MPNLGIIASSISGHLTPAYDPGSFFSLATVTLTSTVSTITFTGIPSEYKHLQIRALTASNSISGGTGMFFNADFGSNYKGHGVYGAGSGTPNNTNTTVMYAPNFTGGAATTAPGMAIIDVLDYSSNLKNKTIRCLDGYDANGSGYVSLNSGLWLNTAPITSITFSLTSFVTGCQFALYGVK